MKKNYKQCKTGFLLFFLLSLFAGGLSPAWAQVTDDFSSYPETTSGTTLGDNWVIIGDDGSYSQFGTGKDYQHYNAYEEAWVATSSNNNYTRGIWLVLKKQVTGTVSFNATNGYNWGALTIYVSKAVESGSSYAVTGEASSYAVPAKTASEKTYEFDAGENPTYIAFCLVGTNKNLKMWSVTYTEYVDPGAIAKPTNFEATSTTYNSATFEWTAGGEETAWQLVYNTDPEFDKNDATPIDITTNPYTLTGLSESTTYYAYLRAKSGEDVSSWTSKIEFSTPAQYPVPTDFAQTAVTETTATMSWTANGGESKWNIKYSTDENFDPASAGTLVAVTANPYTLEGLTDGTIYYAYVQADYGSGHTSNWSNKITLTPTSTLNLLVNDGATTNEYTPIYGYYLDNKTYLTSQFVIPSTSLTSMANRQVKKLTFYSSTANSNLGNPEFEVYLKEVANTTFSQGDAFDTSGTKVYAGTLAIVDGEMEITFTTPFIYTTGNLMITVIGTKSGSYAHHYFYGITSTSSALKYSISYGSSVENFLPKMTIASDEMPAVMTPTDLVKNSVTSTTATLGWTENGDAVTWQIKYSTTEAFDPDSEGTLVEANANPFTVTDLDVETTYYAYVRAKKGGDVSDWSNKVEFTTTELYPKPTAVSVSPADISATFRWTNGEGPTPSAWQIKYSTDENFDPASEGTLLAVTTNPYTLTGLIVGNTYYAYIRADYGESHYSSWSDKLSFTTSFEQELTVNEGDGSTTSNVVPFYGAYTDAAIKGSSQFIIPATQLGSMEGRSINKMTFYTTSDIAWKSGGNPTFKVYLKEVVYEKFENKTFIDWETMTEVYDGEIAFDGSQLTINIATPFEYNGGNLMIGFYQTVAGGYCTTNWVGTSADDEVGVQNASGTTTYNWAAFLPKTTFGWSTLTGSRLEVSTDAIDFGDITQESTAGDKQKTFTISNTGVADLTGLAVSCSGAGYSVSALPRTTITTEGEGSDDIELTVTFAPTTSGSYDGTITVSATSQQDKVITLSANYIAAPIMGVFEDSEATEAATTGQTIDFGYAQGAPSYTYYIKNTGVGTLDVAVDNDGLTVIPSSASLAAGEQQAFEIVVNIAEVDATVTFTGTNHDGGDEVGTFNVTLQGTLMPRTDKFFEGFNYADGDATTTELVGWEINNNTENMEFYSGNLRYVASSTESGNVITPKLRVSGTSDVLRINASIINKSWNNTKVAISYSADKENWTELINKGKDDFTTAGVLQAFELSGIPEGSYYFKIELSDASVDYFYGFSSSLPAVVELDEADTPTLVDGVRDITLNRSYVAGWNTVCLPFATTAEEIFGAGAVAYEYVGLNGDYLRFTQVDDLEAGIPYIVNATAAGSADLTLNNVTLISTASNVVQDGITFQGTFAPIAAPNMENKWGTTASGEIRPGTDAASMKGLRAYFLDIPASVKGMSFDDGITTSIIKLDTTGSEDVRDIFDLAGRKLNETRKGVNIVNGKKVLVK